MKLLIKKSLLSGALSLIAVSSFAADIGGDVYNTPSRTGDVEVYAIKGSINRGLTETSGQGGGGRVTVDDVRVDKGATTGSVQNNAKHTGKAKVYATGDVTLSSVDVMSGAKTGDLQNAPRRTGDLTVYGGSFEASAGLSGVSAGLNASVVADSIKVCSGATAKKVVNAPSTTGKTTIVGGDVSVGSVHLGC